MQLAGVVAGPTLNFEFERHYTRPEWPAVAGHQTASQHLDIRVDDPDGHPFCLFL